MVILIQPQLIKHIRTTFFLYLLNYNIVQQRLARYVGQVLRNYGLEKLIILGKNKSRANTYGRAPSRYIDQNNTFGRDAVTSMWIPMAAVRNEWSKVIDRETIAEVNTNLYEITCNKNIEYVPYFEFYTRFI